ncbi:MAG TPA: MTH1187 family thiamine-binding protein [Gemmatimonadaceae bacterium]|jgi:uncharacterized protein (TIGR00106 family)|nr:MTH1187 family thiamine-binding protein [Gemmatimonadaceae bacterium]
MLFSVTMFPVGGGESLRRPVAQVVDEIDKAGLHYEVSGMDTVIEGDWGDVMPVLQRAEQALRGANRRVFMMLVMDDREGAKNRIHGAVEGVERELHRSVHH